MDETQPRAERYGRHGSFEARPGKGQLLASLLLEAAELLGENPDCQLYVVSRSTEQADVVWVYEAWSSKEAHAASLQDERVMELIGRARPLIVGISNALEFVPVGGKAFAADGAAPDVKGLRDLAVQGHKVFEWIASFDAGSVTDSDLEAFMRAAEAWIIAAARVDPSLGADPDAPAEPTDEDSDEWGSDEEGEDKDNW